VFEKENFQRGNKGFLYVDNFSTSISNKSPLCVSVAAKKRVMVAKLTISYFSSFFASNLEMLPLCLFSEYAKDQISLCLSF